MKESEGETARFLSHAVGFGKNKQNTKHVWWGRFPGPGEVSDQPAKKLLQQLLGMVRLDVLWEESHEGLEKSDECAFMLTLNGLFNLR